MDKILLSECRFLCHVGATLAEQKKLQPMYVDIELYLNLKRAGQSDDLNDTINYSTVHAAIASLLSRTRFFLIEAMAEQITTRLLKEFPLKKITLRLKKPGALRKKNVAWAGVEITRSL